MGGVVQPSQYEQNFGILSTKHAVRTPHTDLHENIFESRVIRTMRANIAARMEALKRAKNAAIQAQEASSVGDLQETQGNTGEQADVVGDEQALQADQGSIEGDLEGADAPDRFDAASRAASGGSQIRQSVGFSGVRPGPADTNFSEGEGLEDAYGAGISEEEAEFQRKRRYMRAQQANRQETPITPEEAEMAARERELLLKQRDLAAESLRLTQEAQSEELHLRSSARKMGLGLSIPSLRLAATVGKVAEELDRRVRSNLMNMTVKDMKSIVEMAVNVADKTSRIVRTAFEMEREVRAGTSGSMGAVEEYSTPEEALDALEELAQTVERYGDGVVVEDEFPGERDSSPNTGIQDEDDFQ